MKATMLLFLIIILLFTSTLETNATSTQEIDFARKDLGVADVTYNTGSRSKIKLMVDFGSHKYVYNLKNSKKIISFPMQLGNGQYSFSIYENTVGTKYKKTHSESSDISLTDYKIAFLNSIQQITWTNDDQAIQLAEALIEDYQQESYKMLKSTPMRDFYGPDSVYVTNDEKIKLFYDYVVKNISYDYEKIKTLEYDYIPDINEIIVDGSGICYDYSVLLAAMLRSQGIPSKLVKGYSSFTDVYHAWNEIYLISSKKWVIVDTTYDSYMYRKKRTYTFEKARTDYTTTYEY